MKLGNLTAALTGVALVIAPVAAQAGTAPKSVVSLSGGVATSMAGSRTSQPVAKKNGADAGVIVVAVIAGAAAIYGLTRVFDNDKSNGD